MNSSNLEKTLKDFNKTHDKLYDYSKFVYSGWNTKGEIVCKIHGSFFMTPGNHKKGQGCPKCKGGVRLTKEDVELQINSFDDCYDYSKFIYLGSETKGEIICPQHGSFFMTMGNRRHGQLCPKCSAEKISKAMTFSREKVIQQFIESNGVRYNYDKFEYYGTDIKGMIICPLHGEFYMTPGNHKQGKGCPKCRYESVSAKNKANAADRLEKSIKSSFRRKEYRVPSGKVILLQGGEPYVLNNLLQTYDEQDIVSGAKNVPKISYLDSDCKQKSYFPDFFIPSENIIIEVKSSYTYLGINQKERTDLKLSACEKLGYKTRLIIENRKASNYTEFYKE